MHTIRPFFEWKAKFAQQWKKQECFQLPLKYMPK
jgi:hypothetical protein